MSPDGSKIASPEEKLLRLIRGKGSSAAPATPHGTLPLKPHAAGRRGQSSVRSRWKVPTWWLTGLNAALACLVIGELVALLLILMRPLPAVVVDLPKPKPLGEQPTPPPVEPAPSLTAAVSRPIFQIPSHQPGSTRSGGSAAPSQQAKSLAARLSLIGIVAGNPPQAIIEDSETKKTHFVTAGQRVIEGLTVEEVRNDRVVLDLDGEKIELSL